jgi:ribosomal protein S18 acetylase RimI-like enzyme
MEMPSVEITLAGNEHEREIMPLMAAFNQHEGIVWRPESMGAALRRVLRDSALGLIMLAQDRRSRAAVGYGLATFGYDLEFAGRDAFITELFVRPSFRGRGLGRALLDSIVEELRLHDTNAVHLMVRPENERARSLYESRDFRVVPRIMMTKLLVSDDLPEQTSDDD